MVGMPEKSGSPLVIEKLDFRQKKAVLEGESRKYSRMLSGFSYGKSQGVLHLPWLPGRSCHRAKSTRRSVPSGPGEVHWSGIRADGAPGSGLGAGPTLSWLFRAHPKSMGMSRRQWRICRLHRTCRGSG